MRYKHAISMMLTALMMSTVFIPVASAADSAGIDLGATLKGPTPEIAITVDVDSIDFGELLPGETSDPHSVTVANVGLKTVDVTTTVEDDGPEAVFVPGITVNDDNWSEYSSVLASEENESFDVALHVPETLDTDGGPSARSYVLRVSSLHDPETLAAEGAVSGSMIVWAEAVAVPVAAFSADVTSGDAPLTVQFTDLSENATSWSWDFGDGTDSTEQSPAHEYTVPGTYIVTLTVTNSAGTDSATETVMVTASPQDTTAPTITDKSPTGTDESTRSVVSVTFSEAMDTSSVKFVVNGVTGTISWNGNVAMFTPSATLKGNTEYTVTVAGKDLAGNELKATSWTFTTANVGTVSGVIKDQDGNPVAGATVTLTSTSTASQVAMMPVFSVESTVGKTLTTTTNDKGEYAFYDVSIGEYTLTVEKDGYKTTTHSVKVTSDTVTSGTATVDTTLSVESGSGDDSIMVLIGVVALIVAVALVATMLIRRNRIKVGKEKEAKKKEENEQEKKKEP